MQKKKGENIMGKHNKRKQEKVPTSCFIKILTGLVENDRYMSGAWSGRKKIGEIDLYHANKLIFKLSVIDKTIIIENDSGVSKIREKIKNLKLLFPDYLWKGDYADYYLRYNDMYDDEYTNLQKKQRIPEMDMTKFFIEESEEK